jgi:hypothetical protein
MMTTTTTTTTTTARATSYACDSTWRQKRLQNRAHITCKQNQQKAPQSLQRRVTDFFFFFYIITRVPESSRYPLPFDSLNLQFSRAKNTLLLDKTLVCGSKKKLFRYLIQIGEESFIGHNTLK